jgi:sorbitol-specific phosphotransferase system component IIBC
LDVEEVLSSLLAIVFLLALTLIFVLHPAGTGAWLGGGLPNTPKSWGLLALELICATFALVGIVLNMQGKASS